MPNPNASPSAGLCVLDVPSYITRFRGARMTWQQELDRQHDSELPALAAVSGAFTHVDGRPVCVLPAMRVLLEAFYLPEAVLPQLRRRP
jgi:hypothetical protein